jgi:hypothetical protein
MLNNKKPSNPSDLHNGNNPENMSLGKLSLKTHGHKREDLENLLSELREQSADEDSFGERNNESSRMNMASPKRGGESNRKNGFEMNDSNRGYLGSNSS